MLIKPCKFLIEFFFNFSIRNLYGFINIYIFAELYIFFSKDSEFLIHMTKSLNSLLCVNCESMIGFHEGR